MPDLSQYYTALQNADAAGDADGARQLAGYIRTQLQPPAPPSQPAQPSGIASLAHGAERGFLPTLGAIGTGALTGMMAGSVAPGIGNIVGGLAGGIAGGLGVQKLQEAGLKAAPGLAKSLGQDPETQAAERSAHPVLSEVGENLPAVVPGVGLFKPALAAFRGISPEIAKLAESGAAKLASKEAATAEELSAMKQAGARGQLIQQAAMNSALMGGMNVAQQAFSDQPFDPRSALISAATGALGMKPTALGEKVIGTGEGLANRLLGRGKTEPAPAASESATTPTSTTSDTGESAPEAAGSVKKTPKLKNSKGEALRPLDRLVSAKALGGSEQKATEQESLSSKPIDESAEIQSGQARPKVRAPSQDDHLDELTGLKDLQPIDTEDPYYMMAKDVVRQTGKTHAGLIRSGLQDMGFDLTPKEATELRQQLIDSGDLVKRGDEYVLREDGDRTDTGAVSGGTEQPVPLNKPNKRKAAGVEPGGVDDAGQRTVRIDSGESEHTPALETQPTVIPPEWHAPEGISQRLEASPKLPELPEGTPERVYELGKPKAAPAEPNLSLMDRISALKLALPDRFQDQLAGMQNRVRQAPDPSKLTGVEKEVSRLEKLDINTLTEPPAEVKPDTKAKAPTTPAPATSDVLKDLIRKGDMQGVLKRLAEPGTEDYASNPIMQELAAQLGELNFGRVKINAEGAEGHDAAAIKFLKDNNKLGAYDPATNTIHLTEEGMNDQTVLHESIHAATVKMLKRFEKNPEKMLGEVESDNPDKINDWNFRNGVLRDAAQHIHTIMAVADKQLPAMVRLKNKRAFQNVYEFVAYAMTDPKFQAELAKIKMDPKLAKYTFGELGVSSGALPKGQESVIKNEQGETVRKTATGGRESLWSQFTKALARMFGGGKPKANEGNLLLEASQAISDILSNPAKVKGVKPLPMAKRVKAPPAKDLSTDEVIARLAKDSPINMASPKSIWEKLKGVLSKVNYENIVTNVENRSRSVTTLDNQTKMSGRAIPEGPGMNLVGQALDSSFADGNMIMNKEAKPLITELKSAVLGYAKKLEINVQDALHRANALRIGMHEPERRQTKFVFEAPLSTSKLFRTNGGALLPASRVREDILEHLHQNTALLPQAKAEMRDMLDRLANTDDTKPVYLDKTGSSPTGLTSIDPKSNAYNVAGEYTPGTIANLQNSYNKEIDIPEFKRVMDALDAVHEKAKEINRQANYWTTPVDNITDVYGYKHYIPLKGNANAKTRNYDYVDKHLGTGHTEFEEKAGGRQTDADNSIIQSMTDLARATARVGRRGANQAFINLLRGPDGKINRQGIIDASPVPNGHITFADRLKDIDMKKYQKQGNIFDYHSDGSFDVYHVHGEENRKYLDALKGEIDDRSGVLHQMADAIRPVTNFMAKMHTLWNVAFAPFNEARHLITNSLKISSQYGTGTLPGFWRDALANNLRGKFFTAARYMRRYNEGDLSWGENAKQGSFERNLYEYLENGGNTEQIQNLSNKGVTTDMLKDAAKVGSNYVTKSVTAVTDLLKLWTHSFELTNRATSYGVLKDAITKKLTAEGYKGNIEKAAQAQAAGETKNLLNFQNVGLWGRDLSALFEFYRANVTGAVAALDAVRPAFISADSYLKSVPERLKYSTDTVQAIKDIIKNAKKDPKLAETRDADIARLQAADQTPARIRANYKQIQKNARMTMLFATGTGLLMHQLAKMMAGQDEQGRNIVETDDMGQWQRTMRFPAQWMGANAKNSFLQIPWGYGLGSLGAVGAQISGAASGHTPLKDTIWNIINPLRESFFPVPTAQFNPFTNAQTGLKFVVDSATPTAFRPLVEAALNIDTFGREVVPTHVNKYGDVYSGGEAIPETYKETARWLTEHTGVEVNPATVQFVVSNYVDGLSRFTQDSYSDLQAAMGTGYWDPKRSLAGMPVSNFIGKQTSVDAREFADAEQEVQRMSKTINMLKNSGHMDLLSDYLDRNPDALMKVTLYNREVNGGIKKLRGMIDNVEASDMDPKDRHDILKDLNDNLHMLQRGYLDATQD